MPKLMIAPPAEVLERVRQEAVTEHRTMRQQIEFLLIQKYGNQESGTSKGASHV